MKKSKLLIIITLLSFPLFVLADSTGNSNLSLAEALGMEAFVSIHMSVFVLYPLANIFNKDGKPMKLFIILFVIRAAILLYFDFFVTPFIAIIDFIAVFIGAFLVVPICTAIKKKPPYGKGGININMISKKQIIAEKNNGIVIKCAKCNSVVEAENKFCGKCGTPTTGNNIRIEVVEPNTNIINNNVQTTPKVAVSPSNFDSMFSLSEDQMIEEFLNRELQKAGIDKNSKLIPQTILKRKKILNTIFSILLFIFISSIFFHLPIYTYIIGIIILLIFYIVTRKYDLIKYLKKEIKSRPSEKISNIVMNIKSILVINDSINIFIPSICIAIILPLFIFANPKIFYEKMDNGYGVRFYTFGLTNYTKVTIPETYKNDKVVSIRGNVFSNMFFLEEVTLPNTITEIRGQAFKNDIKLKKINIPRNLEYLGGGAFYNCTSITSIELPDTLTYMGGETFYNAISLKSIKLSNNITEIRGNTFENCTSLESITIPDSVTRIGGHAFYGNSSLSKVTFTSNSSLNEIGSSAFRMCNSLYEITLPKGVYVNPRAFKESPTAVYYFNKIGGRYE